MIDTQAIRSKILDLAMRGQLTEQLPEDGNAEELYQQILEEKQKLIKDGKIKKQKPLPEISNEEIPFDIPANWKWVRLSDLVYLTSGNQYEEVLNGLPYVKVADMNLDVNAFEIITSSRFASPENIGRIPTSSIIFPKRGGAISTNKKRIVRTTEIYIDSNTMAMTMFFPSILLYAKIWFDSIDLASVQTGTSIPQINNKDIYPLLFPLPPLAEQKRIVEKIEQAFSILDTIDELQAQYADNLTVLKSKLIDAAIQGKLTEQLPEDGTAEELIDRIKIEKEALISSRKIPKEKALPKINSGDIPFDIPDNWNWVRVQDVATYITDYVANGSFATLKANTKTYKEKNYALFVRTMDLSADFKDECSYIDKKSYDFLKKSRLFGGELILPNIGASIGKAFIMPNLGMPMSLAPNSIMLKFTEPIINSYFSFIIKSSYGYNLLNKTQGGSATAKFSKTDLRSLIVPIPPLSEIKRIVQKLEEILPLCERLK